MNLTLDEERGADAFAMWLIAHVEGATDREHVADLLAKFKRDLPAGWRDVIRDGDTLHLFGG